MGEIIWLILIITAFVLEMFALIRHNDMQFPTLTHVILHHVPRWLLAAALGWLTYHFLVQQ